MHFISSCFYFSGKLLRASKRLTSLEGFRKAQFRDNNHHQTTKKSPHHSKNKDKLKNDGIKIFRTFALFLPHQAQKTCSK